MARGNEVGMKLSIFLLPYDDRASSQPWQFALNEPVLGEISQLEMWIDMY